MLFYSNFDYSLFKKFGQPNIYRRIKVSTSKDIIELFNQYDLSGANITSPFKEDILPFLDSIDNVAKELNAVNTIIKKGNHFYGFNTDVYGVENTILNNGLNVKDKKCIVIGSGGAAKAAIYALSNLEALVYSVNRTDSKSLNISKRFNCNHILFGDIKDEVEDAYLIVLAVTKLNINFGDKIKNTIVINANYHNDNAHKALRVINGLDWLINQASKSFEIFCDKVPDYTFMKKSLERLNNNYSNIALIGMPGVGKSFYGEILSEKLGKKFYDTDELIAKKYDLSASEIFKRFGEEKFREYEEEVIGNLGNLENAVVAFGGGSVLSKQTRTILSENYFVINLYVDSNILKSMFLSNADQIHSRPLLTAINLRETIDSIFEKRKNHYFSLSDLTINVVANNYVDNAEFIVKELKANA